MQVGYN